jgi:hypothetical protein
LTFTLEQRIVLVVKRIQTEFNRWTLLRGAASGLAPLNGSSVVPDANLPRYVRRLVQTIAAFPANWTINWTNGLVVYITMPAATLTTVASTYQNPILGDIHTIILTNTTGASRNFVLPATGHKASATTLAVGNNQRRKMTAVFDGSVYDWTVDPAKTL